MTRSGYRAVTSKWFQHTMFHRWVLERYAETLDCILNENDYIVGEWLAQAHSTHYDLIDREPWVVFDLFKNNKRQRYHDLINTIAGTGIPTAPILNEPDPVTVEKADILLGEFGRYGATERAEGCVWRLEKHDGSITLAKFVRHDKEPGIYLEDTTGKSPVWNYRYQS